MKRLFTLFSVLLICIVLASCQSLCSHEFESEITVAPGCESDGERTNTCSKCSYVETEIILKAGHEFDNGTVTQEASCGIEGVLTYACKNCHTTKTENIPALEHSYDEGTVTKEATCVEEGELTYTCTLCGETKGQAIEILPHTLGAEMVTKEATCAEEGQVAKLCAFCDYTEVVERIPKTDDHILEEAEVRSPTCVDKGEGRMDCVLCDYSESFEYDYTDHTYGTPTVLLYPTCTEYGQQQYDCIHCDHSYTEDLYPNGHAYGSGVITKAASCLEEGIVEYTCTECGAVYADAIPLNDHTWSDGNCDDPAVCLVCGYIDYYGRSHNYVLEEDYAANAYKLGARVYVCTECGGTYSECYGFSSGAIYDAETLRWYVADYAASKGFQIVYSSQPGTQYSEKRVDEYSIVDNSGGPDLLLKWYYATVDQLSNQITSDGKSLTDSKLVVNVTLSRSGGGGDSIVFSLVAYCE